MLFATKQGPAVGFVTSHPEQAHDLDANPDRRVKAFAKDPVDAGIETVIASGRRPEQLPEILAGLRPGERIATDPVNAAIYLTGPYDALLASAFFIALTVSAVPHLRSQLRPYSRLARACIVLIICVGWYGFFLAVLAIGSLTPLAGS